MKFKGIALLNVIYVVFALQPFAQGGVLNFPTSNEISIGATSENDLIKRIDSVVMDIIELRTPKFRSRYNTDPMYDDYHNKIKEEAEADKKYIIHALKIGNLRFKGSAEWQTFIFSTLETLGKKWSVLSTKHFKFLRTEFSKADADLVITNQVKNIPIEKTSLTRLPLFLDLLSNSILNKSIEDIVLNSYIERFNQLSREKPRSSLEGLFQLNQTEIEVSRFHFIEVRMNDASYVQFLEDFLINIVKTHFPGRLDHLIEGADLVEFLPYLKEQILVIKGEAYRATLLHKIIRTHWIEFGKSSQKGFIGPLIIDIMNESRSEKVSSTEIATLIADLINDRGLYQKNSRNNELIPWGFFHHEYDKNQAFYHQSVNEYLKYFSQVDQKALSILIKAYADIFMRWFNKVVFDLEANNEKISQLDDFLENLKFLPDADRLMLLKATFGVLQMHLDTGFVFSQELSQGRFMRLHKTMLTQIQILETSKIDCNSIFLFPTSMKD